MAGHKIRRVVYLDRRLCVLLLHITAQHRASKSYLCYCTVASSSTFIYILCYILEFLYCMEVCRNRGEIAAGMSPEH